MRRFVSLGALVALIAGFIVAAPAANAADVSFVQGIVNGKFGEYQAFDVARTPSQPLCADGAPSSFGIRVSNPASPFSSSSRASVVLDTGYLQVFESGIADFPWGLKYYNAEDQELRYDSTSRSWITQPAGGWTTEKVFSTGGNLVAASENGILHISQETGGFNGGYGTYLSITTPYVANDVFTYTPAADLNNCTTYKTTNSNGTTTDQNGPVLNPEASKTMYFPNAPLGAPTNDATLRKLVPNRGKVYGPIYRTSTQKSDYYYWGVTTKIDGNVPASVQIYPTNPAATMKVDGVLYRSGQPIALPLDPDGVRSRLVTVEVTSVDGTATNTYTLQQQLYFTPLPVIESLSTKTVQNEGGTVLTISGKYLNFARGVAFTPNADLADPRAVTVMRGSTGYKQISKKEIRVTVPAVPKLPGDTSSGKYYTGKYNVIMDGFYGDSEVTNSTVVTYKNTQFAVKALRWAKKVGAGVTKLIGLPVKLNTGKKPAFNFKVRFLGRSQPAGDVAGYTIIEKKNGYYISFTRPGKAQVTATISASGTKTYAPYTAQKTWVRK